MNVVIAIKKRIIKKAAKIVLRILQEPEVSKWFWEIQQGRLNCDCKLQKNIQIQLWAKASEQTAEYVLRHMMGVEGVDNRSNLFNKSLEEATIDGNILEFGVEKGDSIRKIAELFEGQVHGFDSFQGLPEGWFDHFKEGAFSTNDQVPNCPKNVLLHPGWFKDTLPEYAAKYPQPIRFMHVDCDLYSSAKTIFHYLADKITKGTVIQFDEYFNYPSWQNHEFKAFQEFIQEHHRKYHYIGYDRNGFSAAVKINA